MVTFLAILVLIAMIYWVWISNYIHGILWNVIIYSCYKYPLQMLLPEYSYQSEFLSPMQNFWIKRMKGSCRYNVYVEYHKNKHINTISEVILVKIKICKPIELLILNLSNIFLRQENLFKYNYSKIAFKMICENLHLSFELLMPNLQFVLWRSDHLGIHDMYADTNSVALVVRTLF